MSTRYTMDEIEDATHAMDEKYFGPHPRIAVLVVRYWHTPVGAPRYAVNFLAPMLGTAYPTEEKGDITDVTWAVSVLANLELKSGDAVVGVNARGLAEHLNIQLSGLTFYAL